MVRLTLVPETLARRGHRFTFQGANTGEECVGCPFTKMCFGLQPHHTYQVSNLRDVVHPCKLHDEGKVRVVEVLETEFQSTLERTHLRGTAAHWTPVPCRRPSCPNFALCHPKGPLPGAKMQIVEQLGKLECPAGYDLERVKLKAME